MVKHLRPILSDFDLAAPGGVERLLAFHRAVFGDAVMEDPPKNDPPKNDPPGYKAPATQADLDAIVESRLRREREQNADRFKDYDALKDKAGKYDAHVAASATEQEKAVAAAKEEAAKEATEAAARKNAPKLVLAEFRAAAAGRIDKDRLATLTDDIDLAKFLTSDGEVDAEKVAKKVVAWAPEETKRTGPKKDPSQGSRGGRESVGEGGRAEAERRFGKKNQQ